MSYIDIIVIHGNRIFIGFDFVDLIMIMNMIVMTIMELAMMVKIIIIFTNTFILIMIALLITTTKSVEMIFITGIFLTSNSQYIVIVFITYTYTFWTKAKCEAYIVPFREMANTDEA